MRNRLIWVTYVATRGHVISGPVLLPRSMSGPMALPQQGLCLMSVACVTTGATEELAPVIWALESWSCPLPVTLARWLSLH